jgi:hypothetical protein
MQNGVPVTITSVTYGDPQYIGTSFPSQAAAARWLGDPPQSIQSGRGKFLREICLVRKKYWKGYMFEKTNVFTSDPAHTCLPKIKSGPMEEKDVTVVRKQRNGEQQAEFRRGCLQLHGDKCAFCGTTENVEAAHITSQREWDGRDYEANGIPLCKGVCHPAFDSGRLKWNPNTWSLQLVNFPKEGTFVEPHPEARNNVERAYWHK